MDLDVLDLGSLTWMNGCLHFFKRWLACLKIQPLNLTTLLFVCTCIASISCAFLIKFNGHLELWVRPIKAFAVGVLARHPYTVKSFKINTSLWKNRYLSICSVNRLLVETQANITASSKVAFHLFYAFISKQRKDNQHCWSSGLLTPHITVTLESHSLTRQTIT